MDENVNYRTGVSVQHQKELLNGFSYINSEERERQFPETWHWPSAGALDAIKPGDSIKVGVERSGMHSESFWTMVLEVLDSGFLVSVDNRLLFSAEHGLAYDDTILVGREHIIDLWDDGAGSAIIAPWHSVGRNGCCESVGVQLCVPDANVPVPSRALAPSPQEPTGPMTPAHPRWDEFLNRLAGPEGCDFHRKNEADPGSVTWICDSEDDTCPLARSVLADMGFTSNEIDQSIEYFHQHGGYCDCEILLNVGKEIR